MKTIILLCFLGDPCIPAVSCDRAGGFNVDSKEIVEMFKNSLLPITVITNSSSFFTLQSEVLSDNITLYRINFEGINLNNQQQLSLHYNYAYREICNLIKDKKLEPVFIHSMYWYSGKFAKDLSKEFNIPFIHSAVALACDKKLTKSNNFCEIQDEYENYFFKKASLVLSITDSERDSLMKYYNIPREKIVVTGRDVNMHYKIPDHNAYGYAFTDGYKNEIINDYDLFENFKWWNAGAITFFGRLKVEKGLINIIKAWMHLYDKYHGNVPPLWIIGGSAIEIYNFRKLLKKHKVFIDQAEHEYKICWWGYISQESISSILLKTMVVVTNSQYEAGGRVIIESMSIGKPVISSPTGFAKDMIRDWFNGFLVDYGNVDLLSIRMEHFIHQPLLSSAMGLAAKDTFCLYAKKWSYLDKMKNIYSALWKNNLTELINLDYFEDNIDFNSLTNYLKHDRVESFPYQTSNQEIIFELLQQKYNIKKSDITLSKSLSNHCFVFEIKRNTKDLMVLSFYSRINKAKIIDDKIDIEILSSKYLINKIEALKNNPYILKIDYIDTQYHFYVSNHVHTVIKNCDQKLFCEILQLIYNFNSYYVNLECNHSAIKCPFVPLNVRCTLSDLWDYVKRLSLTTTKYYKDFYSKYEKEIDRITKQIHTKNIKFRLSYGKNILSHIVKYEDRLYFIPTPSYFISEEGFDPANLILECILTDENLGIQTIDQYISYTSNTFDIPKRRLIQWCLLIINIKLISASTILNKHMCDKLVSAWELIKKLYQ